MMKSYLRYEPKKIFGIISSPQCNAIYDFSGNLAITGGLQNLAVWNLRQSQQIASIGPSNPNYPYHTLGTVVSLARSKDRSTIAAGYSSGEVLIFDYITKSVVATLRGHRSAVLSLTYDESGTLLASGGADSDIFIWDMVTLAGKYKLRSHKDAVTGVVFVPSPSPSSSTSQPKYLVSSSKDTLLKVWDMSTQHCIQTVVGHRCEIWSIALAPLPLADLPVGGEATLQTQDYLILSGSSDEMIRGYVIRSPGTDQTSHEELSDEMDVLHYVGSLPSQGGEKCAGLEFHPQSGLLLAISGLSSKHLEMFRLRSVAEVKKKLKRRAKRQREKNDPGSGEVAALPEGGDEKPTLEDYFESVSNLKSPHKIKSLAFGPVSDRDGSYKVLASTSSNTLEVYRVTVPSQRASAAPNQYSLAKLSVLEMHGHRSDVRCVCVSSDGLSIATVSSEGAKIWSTKSFSCIRSCATGYGVSMTFITGNRYILIGTKEGRIQIVDSSIGELVVDQEAHEGPVWSVALQPPDGKAFMSGGADKVVKFWDFTVTNGSLGIELSRQLMMTHDIMCVGYSPVKKETADRLLVAIGLLDHTVKVFYNDSLKFYLSLYGHKLPVMCLDISHDGNILVSGSADKTIKIWGLDFGDCHRSLLAHEDTVTCVRFQPETHYFFSSSKDGSVKYWDADRFEQILYLPNHVSSVWSVAVSPDGSYAVSVGQDRSLRIWERTEDLVFIEEERERALEAKIELDMEKRDQHDATNGSTGEQGLVAALPSIESLKGGERIMEALELVEVEYARSLQANYKPSLLLREMPPLQYMAWTLRDSVKSADLEMALIVIPFHLVHRLLFVLLLMSRRNIEIEIIVRCVVFLLRCHQSRLVSILSLSSASSALITHIGVADDCEGIDISPLPEIISELRTTLREHIDGYRNLIGTNLTTMRFLLRVLENKRSYRSDQQETWRELEGQLGKEKKKRKKAAMAV